MRVRLPEDVERPRPCQKPRPRLAEPGLLGRVGPRARAGFPEVIPGCPHEIADQVRNLLDLFPVARELVRERLAADDDALRMLVRVDRVTSRRVVITRDVERVERGGDELVGARQVCDARHAHAACLRDQVEQHAPARRPARGRLLGHAAFGVIPPLPGAFHHHQRQVDPARDGPRGVERVEQLDHRLLDPDAGRLDGLAHLVADGIHDDARVVVVAAHESVQVVVAPVEELPRVIVRALRRIPHVPGLVHDVHPELVASVEQRGRRRVVRDAHRVEPGGLEQADAPELALAPRRRAEDAVVAVDAAAAQKRLAPVHEQALRVPSDPADAERRLGLVDDASLADELDAAAVKVRRVGAPEPRALEHDLDVVAGLLRERLLVVEDRHARLGADVIDLDAHRGRVDRDGCHAHSLGRNVLGACGPERHGPVNPSAGIPPAIGLLRVVCVDFDNVLARLHEPGQVDEERDEPVRRRLDLLAVHADPRIAVDALELEHQRARRLLLVELELLAVTARAPEVIAARAPRRRIRPAPRPQHRVMRHHDRRKLPAVPRKLPPAAEISAPHARLLADGTTGS